jgi:hypothetical protein
VIDLRSPAPLTLRHKDNLFRLAPSAVPLVRLFLILSRNSITGYIGPIDIEHQLIGNSASHDERSDPELLPEWQKEDWRGPLDEMVSTERLPSPLSFKILTQTQIDPPISWAYGHQLM